MSKKQKIEDHIPDEQMEICHEEFIGQYRRKYEYWVQKRRKDTPPELFHLYALKHLCEYAGMKGLDAEWIHRAFANETAPKRKTVLKNYYLGGFVAALVECECNINQACAETAHWLKCSPTTVENAHNNHMKLQSGYSPLEFSILLTREKFKIASAFINSVPYPFPEGKQGNKIAEDAYKRLAEKIQQYGYSEEPALEFLTQKFSG